MTTLMTSRGTVEYRFDRRDAKVVLLLNGGHTNPEMRESDDYFAARGYGVVSVARPGYCATDNQLDQTYGDFEAAVVELLDHLKIGGKAVVLGISAGGRAAMRFAQLHPDRCSRLVLLSSVSFAAWPGIAIRLGSYIGLNPAIERHTWRLIHWSLRKFPEIATEWIFAPLTTLGARDVLASYSPETRAKITSLFMDFRSGSGFMNDIGRRARRGEPHAIRVPTLIVHSKFDGQVGPSHAEMLAALIPNARLLLSDAESHLMWVSPRWVEVERELDRFLEKD